MHLFAVHGHDLLWLSVAVMVKLSWKCIQKGQLQF